MPAFFVHGTPDTHHVWDPVRRQLGDVPTIAVDLPGFGAPVPAGFAATKEAYVDWLIAEIERIGVPVDIVGHDWGCTLSMRVASLRPDLVRSWAVGDGPLNADYDWHPLAKNLQTPGEGEAYLRALDRREFAQSLKDDGVPADHAEAAAARIDETMGDSLLKLFRSGVNVGAEWQPGLADVVAPGLIFWGVRDPTVPIENGHILARDTGTDGVLELDAGHWTPVQQPAKLAGALRDFWSGIV